MMIASHWVDYVILGIIALSVLTGLFRGFVKELIALCVWIVAIWLAFTYSQSLAVWLQPYIHDKTARVVAMFIIILLLTLIAGSLINAMLSFVLQRSGLSGTDRILGMGFGFVRGVFIVAILILAAQMTAMPHAEAIQASALYPKFQPIVNWLYGLSPDFVKRMQRLEHSTK